MEGTYKYFYLLARDITSIDVTIYLSLRGYYCMVSTVLKCPGMSWNFGNVLKCPGMSWIFLFF